jgi:hypothetical protein
MTYSTPANIEDAFDAGWWFGRYPSERMMDMVRRVQKVPNVSIRREFARGVFEGHAFQTEWNAGESAQIIAHMAG